MNFKNNIGLQRIGMLAAGAFAVSFTGLPHIWSVFTPFMVEATGWSMHSIKMNFYIVICCFVVGTILGGRMQDSFSPRLVASAGGLIFSVGVLFCAFMPSNAIFFYLYYGVLQGLGSGAVYIAVITTAQKWYPDRPGFGSGIVVAANGLSGLFMAPFCRVLLVEYGLRITFLTLAGLIFLSFILTALFVTLPETIIPVNESVNDGVEKSYTAKQMFATGRFYILCISMMLAITAYFIVSPISQVLLMERGLSAQLAITAVMFGSIANAAARFVVPSLGDRYGRAKSLAAVLFIGSAASFVLTIAGGYLSLIAIIVLFISYGGTLGSFPSLTSQAFGMKHAGENYGYMLMGLAAPTLVIPILSVALERSYSGGELLFVFGGTAAMIAAIMLILYSNKYEPKQGVSYSEDIVINVD